MRTWNAAMVRVAAAHSDLFKSWFARLTFGSYAKGVLTVQAPSVFVQRYIETHHLPLLIDSVEQELDTVERVVFGQ